MGPPHHIYDRFANILIKVDSSICYINDLNKILTCYVGLVNLPENVASSKMQINPEKQDTNEPSNSAILGQAKHKYGTSDKSPHKCQECLKQFTQKSNLKRHMLIHKSIKPYKCQECHRQFTYKGSLKKHMLIHKGKKHKCQVCQKQFTQKSTLTRHMLIHKGIKPYKCQDCQKQFTQKWTLTIHMLAHEGIKPYKCQECQKQFTHIRSLRVHMLMHKGKNYINVKSVTNSLFIKEALKGTC